MNDPVARDSGRRSDEPTHDGAPVLHIASSDPDELLIARLARRDASALAECFDKWSDPVHALVVRIAGNACDVDAIVEDVFLLAWNRATAFPRAKTSLKIWLLSLARTEALRAVRGGHTADEEAVTASGQREHEEACDDLLRGVGVSELSSCVAIALGSMPREQREVLEMIYFEDCDLSRLSAVLAIPVGDALQRVRTALRSLHRRLSAVANGNAFVSSPQGG